MIQIKLDNSKQLESLFDHYYDNVHWAESEIKPDSTFNKWLEKEYCAKYDFLNQTIVFENPKNFTHFSLRWL